MTRAPANIALTGYRATGKSIVGRALADRLGCPLIDTDQLVRQGAGCSIREIFEAEGEAGFRDRETEALSQCVAQRHVVLSLGGGAVLRAENRELLQAHSAIVWLTADPEEIWRRLEGDAASAAERPALTDRSGYDEIVDVLGQREPIYRQLSDIQIETGGKPVAQIVDEIVLLLDDLALPEILRWIRKSPP